VPIVVLPIEEGSAYLTENPDLEVAVAEAAEEVDEVDEARTVESVDGAEEVDEELVRMLDGLVDDALIDEDTRAVVEDAVVERVDDAPEDDDAKAPLRLKTFSRDPAPQY
jgi:hypothetical protein